MKTINEMLNEALQKADPEKIKDYEKKLLGKKYQVIKMTDNEIIFDTIGVVDKIEPGFQGRGYNFHMSNESGAGMVSCGDPEDVIKGKTKKIRGIQTIYKEI